MRAARIPCTVAGILISVSGRVSFNRAVARQRAVVEEHLDRLLDEKRVACGSLRLSPA
jgi:hypothetical protein